MAISKYPEIVIPSNDYYIPLRCQVNPFNYYYLPLRCLVMTSCLDLKLLPSISDLVNGHFKVFLRCVNDYYIPLRYVVNPSNDYYIPLRCMLMTKFLDL